VAISGPGHAPAPSVPISTPPERGRLRLDAGVALGRTVAEVGAAAGPALALSWRHRGGAVLGVAVDALLLGAELTAAAGSVSVAQTLAQVQLGYETSPARRLAAFAAVGLGAQHTLARGHAGAGYVARTEAALSGALGAGAGASVRLGGPLSIAAGVGVLHLVGPPEIAIAGQRAGSVSSVCVHGWAGLRVDL
jgi:hypothetical protein